jgi:molecular chaperone DnaK (HSP70)
MSSDEAVTDGTNGPNPADRHAIGISFGNSNTSIAFTTVEGKAEVIANEDGGI